MRGLLVGASLTAVVLLAGCGPVTEGAAGNNPASASVPAPASVRPSAAGTASTSVKASASAGTTVVPVVSGQRLSEAEHMLGIAGINSVKPVDDTGRNRIVIDPENWVVDTQSPAAGARVPRSTTVTLRVRRPSDTATPATKLGVIPNVVCMNLQDAQNAMQDSGYLNLGSADGSGKGRMQILDRDWVVIAQSVRAGSKLGLGRRIVLTSVKYGESTGSSGCHS
jgi:hypothetical protein